MPASLKDLRSRIRSTKNTQQITKAMKLVSAAKFGRAQTSVIQARPYSTALSRLAGSLVGKSGGDDAGHALLKSSASNVALVIVVSSERGLAGGYNANVAKAALRTIEELEGQGKSVSVLCIGKKAFQIISKRRAASLGKGYRTSTLTQKDYIAKATSLVVENGVSLITTPFDKPTFDMANRLSHALTELYEQGHIGQLVYVYNKFQSAMTQIPTAESFLPIEPPKDVSGTTANEPIFEPNAKVLLDAILPRYLATRIFQTLLEAIASEHGARMTAMDSATRNAKEMERKLQITYQRARQAAITRELIEIISGAEAL